MGHIIYIVEGTKPDQDYGVICKCFNDYKVAKAYCNYRNEYELQDKKYRVIEEEVI